MARRILWPLAAAFALAFAGAMFLLGMPGAFFLNIFGDAERFAGANAEAWTAMQRISWLAPLGVPPAIWALGALWPRASWYWWWLAGFAGYIVGGAIATQFV
jgi:hypothetical protein